MAKATTATNPRVLEDVSQSQNGAEDANANSASNSASASASGAASEKKTIKAKFQYHDPKTNTFVNFVTPDCDGWKVTFADGTERTGMLSELSDGIRQCATLQGLATRFQRGYQSIRDNDAVVSAYDETLDDLKNGVWIETSNGEPKVTQLAMAVANALRASGETVDDARQSGIVTKLAGMSDEERKQVRERPQVASELAKIALEAAQKRAEEKAKAAANAGESATSDLASAF